MFDHGASISLIFFVIAFAGLVIGYYTRQGGGITRGRTESCTAGRPAQTRAARCPAGPARAHELGPRHPLAATIAGP